MHWMQISRPKKGIMGCTSAYQITRGPIFPIIIYIYIYILLIHQMCRAHKTWTRTHIKPRVVSVSIQQNNWSQGCPGFLRFPWSEALHGSYRSVGLLWATPSGRSDPGHFCKIKTALTASIGTAVCDYYLEAAAQKVCLPCWCNHRVDANKSEHGLNPHV